MNPTPIEPLNGPADQHLTWSKVGSEPNELLALMADLYWTGVRRDVLEIIRTLRSWRHEEYVDVTLNEDQLCVGRDPYKVSGFGAFLNRATIVKDHNLWVPTYPCDVPSPCLSI
jgi:hypothetical protein